MNHQEAARRNNEGVRLMLQGENETAATTLFTESLLAAKTLLSTEALSRPSDHDEMSADMDVFHSAVQLPRLTSAQHVEAAGGPFIYESAIILSAPDIQNVEAEAHFLNTLSATSIFNAALLHQRAAISGRQGCLRKAEHLYKMSIKILQGLTTWNGTATTVLVASRNNLSQIQIQLGSLSDARQNIAELSLLVQDVWQSGAQELFPTEEWDGMITNTLVLEGTNAAPAA